MRTDYKPLVYIFMQPYLNDQYARWLERLAEFDLKFEYIPGKENAATDVLSCYGKVIDAEHVDPSMLHSLADHSVEQVVRAWLTLSPRILTLHHVLMGLLHLCSMGMCWPPFLVRSVGKLTWI